MIRHYTPKHITKKKLPLQQLYLAVAMLLVLAVGSFAWTSATLARYVSTASGSSTARVAAFVVNASGENDQTLTLQAVDQSASYPFTVSNKTEDGAVGQVTTNYGVTVQFPSALSDGVSLALKKGDTTYTVTNQDSNTYTYTFQNVGTFQPGVERTDSLELVFTCTSDGESADLSGIIITVNAEQQD